MSVEQNRTLVQRTFEALNNHNLDGVVSYCAPACRFHGWAAETLDAAGYKAAMLAILAGFPDAHFRIDDIVAEGDKVAARHTLQGTHQAEFQGIPATGKKAHVSAIVMFRIENGAAVELWLNADLMGLMQQLGVIPA